MVPATIFKPETCEFTHTTLHVKTQDYASNNKKETRKQLCGQEIKHDYTMPLTN